MPVTLNISNLNIKLVAASGKTIEKWETLSLPAGLVKDGNILDVKAVAEKIDSLFDRLHLPRKRVLVTLSGISFTYRLLTLPSLKPALLKEAVTRAAQKEIPLPLDSLYIDWQIVKDDGKETRVFLAGIPRNLVDTVLQTAGLAKITLAALDIKPLAAARAAGQSGSIIVDFDPDCFNIVILSEGIPVILHTVIPKSEAAGLEDHVSQMLDELNRTINFYNLTHTEKPIPAGAPLVLCGEYAGQESTFQLLRGLSEYSVQPLAVSFALPEGFSPAVYGANTGLLLKDIAGSRTRRPAKNSGYEVNLDFLAARQKSLARQVSTRDILIPSLVVLGLVLIIFLIIVKSQVDAQTTKLQTDLDKVNRELRLARAAADQTAITEKQITELNGKIQALAKENETISGKGALSGILDFINVSLPSGAILKDTVVTAKQITLDGSVILRADIFNYTDILEKQGGYSEVRIASINELTGASGTQEEGYEFRIVITR
jgi:Tfp pilus assembly PilM family ATPase